MPGLGPTFNEEEVILDEIFVEVSDKGIWRR